MKRLFLSLVMLSICIVVNAQMVVDHFSFSLFDSVLRENGTTLVDLSFPASVNREGGLKTSKSIKSRMGNYRLYSYKTAGGTLKRDKVVFNLNDDRNFQFFYLKLKGFYIGAGYYAYGKKLDDVTDADVPYIPSRLDAYSVFNDINSKYVIVYDKIDAVGLLPRMSSSIRIFLLDVNYLPKKVLFKSEEGCFLYQVDANKFFKLRSVVDFSNTDFNYLFDIKNYEVDGESKLRVAKGVPFLGWYMK